MQPLFDAFTADSPMVDPIMEIAEAYKKPVFIHCGHPPFSLPWQIGLLAERHPHVPTVMSPYGTRTWRLYRRQSEYGVQV